MIRKLTGACFVVLVTLGTVGIVAAAPAGATPAQTVPIFECAFPSPTVKGHYITAWGYENSSSHTETYGFGSHNRFSPGADNQGQGTTFLPGRHDNAVILDWDGSANLTWKLGDKTARVDNEPTCKNNPVPITGSGFSAIVALCSVAVLGIGAAWLFGRRRRPNVQES